MRKSLENQPQERFKSIPPNFSKKKKKKTCRKKRISWGTIFFFFSVGFFFFWFVFSAPHFLTLEEDTGWWRVYFVYLVGLRFGLGSVQSTNTFNTGRDSVDSPSGCKVKEKKKKKTLMYSTFANELREIVFSVSTLF